MLVRLAVAAGYALRGVAVGTRVLPGLLGAACVVYGLSLLHITAGWVAAGAFLLLLDARTRIRKG